MSDDDKIDDTLERACAELNARREAPYDGLLGTLPEWMPQPLAQEFESVRNSLLREEGLDAEKILGYLRVRKASLDPDLAFSNGYFPIKFVSQLDALLYIKLIVELGPDKGIAQYLDGNPEYVNSENQNYNHLARGKKTIDASRKGHEAVHGTKNAKEERWSLYRRLFADVMQNSNSNLSQTRAAEITVKKLVGAGWPACSPRTILRAVKKVTKQSWTVPATV